MISAIDGKLLSLLQRNGRLTNAELAEEVGLSQSACHRRVKQLEESGVIDGYAALVNRNAIELNVLAYVFVKLESHAEDALAKFEKQIDRIDEVVACHAIAGAGDYLLKVVARDMDAFADIALKKIVRLPGVKDSTSNFVLSTMKEAPGWPV